MSKLHRHIQHSNHSMSSNVELHEDSLERDAVAQDWWTEDGRHIYQKPSSISI